MTLRQFVKDNKDILDKHLREVVKLSSVNNADREGLVINDEGFYNMARQAGWPG